MFREKQVRLDRGMSIDIKNNLVSIIVPIYNVAPFLHQCLNSLRSQSHRNIEVLMINDGSTDNSAAIAESFTKTDERFILINKENGGQGSARNIGLREAKGKYIAFVDSDDWVDENYIEVMLRCIIANDADIGMCGVVRAWDNGTRRRNPISNDKEIIISNIESFLYKASYVVWDKLYRVEILKGFKFEENMKFEDYCFTPRVLANANKIVAVPDVLYFYRWRSTSTTNEIKVNKDILKAQKILEASSFANQYPDVIKSYFVRNVMGSLIWAMCHDNKYLKDIEQIMNYGSNEYDFNLKHVVKYIGNNKTIYSRLLMKKRYRAAILYVKTCDEIKTIFRPYFHRILAFTKRK